VDDEIEIEIKDDDLRIDVFPRLRGRAAARQQDVVGVVRITHLPTNIVVSCQQERSQGKKQGDRDEDAQGAAVRARGRRARCLRRRKSTSRRRTIAMGPTRSARNVFQPYTMVNDHRTELKVSDVHKVMDGDLDPFIEAFLQNASGVTGK